MSRELLETIEPLLSVLEQRNFLVAYSGGLDSHVLLHLMSNVPDIAVRAVHVDHGLQDVSPWWSRHCRDICSELGIPLERVSLKLDVPAGHSIEAYARKQRYAAFAELLEPDEVLLTAHHQNDQAETLLIQLLRGAGGAGLSAMPVIAQFAKGQHFRPLLNFSRQQFEAYAEQHGLSFVEDMSNADLRFDRNFLRHQILPQLKERWPGCHQTLSRASMLQAETQRLLESYITQDLEFMAGSVDGTLSVELILQCQPERRRALIRRWVADAGFRYPSAKKLQHIVSDVFQAADDATPLVHWEGVEIRRYRDDVYIMPPLSEHDIYQSVDWDLTQDLPIESLGIVLESKYVEPWAQVLDKKAVLTVSFRQGGEVMKPAGSEKTHTLKHIFQQFSVPPWLRGRIPLLFLNDELLIVWGVCQVEPSVTE
ncbi:MAG: tRNA lysidine(34) synthetase TilS [Leucothrix sp.]